MYTKYDTETLKAASLDAITLLNNICNVRDVSTRHLQETVIDISEKHNVDSATLFGFLLKHLNATSDFLVAYTQDTTVQARKDIRDATEKISHTIAVNYDVNPVFLLRFICELNIKNAE